MQVLWYTNGIFIAVKLKSLISAENMVGYSRPTDQYGYHFFDCRENASKQLHWVNNDLHH